LHFQKENKKETTSVPPNECHFFPELQKKTTACIEIQKGGKQKAHDNS